MSPPDRQSAAARALAVCLIFVGYVALILTFGAAALGALLLPSTASPSLRGALTDFAAPMAVQAHPEGWAALSERV